MNRATLNDLIDRTAGDFAKFPTIRFMGEPLKGTKQSPLFRTELSHDIREIVSEPDLCCNGDTFALPFPTFRMLDEHPFDNGATAGFVVKLVKDKAGPTIVIYDFAKMPNPVEYSLTVSVATVPNAIKFLRDFHDNPSGGFLANNIHTFSAFLRPFAVIPGDGEHKARCKAQGLPWVETDAPDRQQRSIVTPLLQMFSFLALVNHPRHYVVEVSPPANGNPVSWVQARSHYIVLDTHHARQAREGRRDFDGSITRAMHRRRAHWRTFRDECFKTMKGQRILVRSAWIGPSEWEGSDRQVYRVLDPRSAGSPSARN